MTKKPLLLSLLLLALLIATPVYAETKVLLNNKVLSFDVPPIVENGRTLVPVRVIFEALGAQVSFDAATNTVIATKGTTIIKMKIGGNAFKNDQPIQLDVPAKIITGRTLVPLRFISEALGATVNYEAATQSVIISSPSTTNYTILEPESIFIFANPSVFSLETYDDYGNYLGHGSGFLIDNQGKAVTNFHVIDQAYSARAKFSDGRLVNIIKVLYSNEERDVAIIQLDGTNYSYLPLGDSESLNTGQKVLAIGNPLGLENTISDGIISTARRDLDGYTFIQITTPISPGSSGGVLLNYKGEAIGITSAYYENGQNLNFAVPINDVKAVLTSTENSRVLPRYQKILKELQFENQYLSFDYPSNWYKKEGQLANTTLLGYFANADTLKGYIYLTIDRLVNVPLEEYVHINTEYLKIAPMPFNEYKVSPVEGPLEINEQIFYKFRISGLTEDEKIEEVIYLTKRNSDIYMLVLFSTQEEYAQNLPVLEKMVKTLRFK